MEKTNSFQKNKEKQIKRANKYSFKMIIKPKKLLLLIFINFFFVSRIFCIKKFQLNNLNLISEIIMTIKGTGNQYILNNKSRNIYEPSKIFINGILQNYTDFIVYNLIEKENTIKIIYDYFITNSSYIFYNLSNLIKLDLL